MNPKFIAVALLMSWSLGLFTGALIMELFGSNVHLINIVAWAGLILSFVLRIVWRRDIGR